MIQYRKQNTYIGIVILVIIGAINWGFIGLFNINIIQRYLSFFGKTGIKIEKIIYILIALCGIYLLVQRETYLPFLGEAAIPDPQKIGPPEIKGERITKVLSGLPPNTKVLYWGTLPSEIKSNNFEKAYNHYENQGVAITDNNGVVELVLAKPVSYIVPIKGLLRPHIHYRYWKQNGIASAVKTTYI